MADIELLKIFLMVDVVEESVKRNPELENFVFEADRNVRATAKQQTASSVE